MRKLRTLMNPFTPNITFWYEHKTTADTVFDIVCGWLCETLVPDKDFFIKKSNMVIPLYHHIFLCAIIHYVVVV